MQLGRVEGMSMKKLQQTDYYREQLGFRLSYRSGRYLVPKCDCCEALIINGVPTHEIGCPRAVHECAGCNSLVPARQKYCQDCL